ncbi:Mut7-C RNAse domain-containing protein [Candidatus Zixiibacteriota bacterium]
MDLEPKRFIADVMLGRLAKWLRIIGYDTLYDRNIEDSQLIRNAARENRILLTRDAELFDRGGFQGVFIEAQDLSSQLAQIIKELALKPTIAEGVRCPLCNESLHTVHKETVRELVPAFVYATQLDFSRCPRCGKIFWKGTHWQKIKRRLEEMGFTLPSGEP